MTGNATPIRQTARPRGGRPASGRAPCYCTQTAPPRESPSRQLACHSRARRRPYRQLALLPAAAPHSPRDRPAYRQERSEAAVGRMTGTAIAKARPPETRSRQRRRHGHAARTSLVQAWRQQTSHRALPAPLAPVTTSARSPRTATPVVRGKITATPTCPARRPPPQSFLPAGLAGQGAANSPACPRQQNRPICAPPAMLASGSSRAPTRQGDCG
jgi:hypothetical protein